MSDTFNDASTTLEDTSFLGHYLEAQIAKVAAQSETGTPASYIPTCKTFGYPNLDELKEKILDDDYIILDDDFFRELKVCVDTNPGAVKELLENHSMKNKIIPDPEFATSPICITDPDSDFSLYLSLISTAEADPIYGRENDDSIAHLTKLAELGSLFTTDERIRKFYVAKLFSFFFKGRRQIMV